MRADVHAAAPTLVPDLGRKLAGVGAMVAGELPLGRHLVDAPLNIGIALVGITIAVRLIVPVQWTVDFPCTLLMYDCIGIMSTSSPTTFLFIK